MTPAYGRENGIFQEAAAAQSCLTPSLALRKMIPLVEFEKGLQEYKFLTSAKIACRSSHLSVIRDIAEDKNKDVSIVLEDDVDMGWDIVFIGKDFPPITTMILLHAP